MAKEELPTWVKNKMAYDKKYERENKIQVAIKLNKVTEPELVEIYQSIPNKSKWFRDCLRQYAAEHPQKDGE